MPKHYMKKILIGILLLSITLSLGISGCVQKQEQVSNNISKESNLSFFKEISKEKYDLIKEKCAVAKINQDFELINNSYRFSYKLEGMHSFQINKTSSKEYIINVDYSNWTRAIENKYYMSPCNSIWTHINHFFKVNETSLESYHAYTSCLEKNNLSI